MDKKTPQGPYISQRRISGLEKSYLNEEFFLDS